jgi:hypothetical protein
LLGLEGRAAVKSEINQGRQIVPLSDTFSSRDVLEELDDDARLRAAFFPDFGHGYNYHVDARLSAYADTTRWAIVIEQLHVNPRWGSFGGVGISLNFHGNCIDLSSEPNAGRYNLIQVPDLLANGPSGPLLAEAWSDQILLTAKDVRVRGNVVPITTDENYYWARRIEITPLTHEQINEWIKQTRQYLSPERAEEKVRYYEKEIRPRVGKFELRTWDLVRGMVPEHRELLLATEAERRRGIPKDIPLILQIDEWDHPRLLEGEIPSGSIAFKQVAKVLSTQDRSLWKFEAEEGNVHWRNWPQSGSL